MEPLPIDWLRGLGAHGLSDGEVPCVAMPDPTDEFLIAAIEFRLGRRIEPVAMSAEQIRGAAASNESETTDPSEPIWEEALRNQIGHVGWEAEPVVRLVESIVDAALRSQATDIHLEPEEEQLKVRFRTDGMLLVHQTLPVWVREAVAGRLKIMANLDISEKRLPQDGRISWSWRGNEIDVRVSTLPTRFGEKIVLRLLRQLVAIQKLDQLAMPAPILEHVEYYFGRPQGMLLVTGPTGSGKSSSLYAGLQQMLGKHINITTIEDPVEYDLPGANQVQINEKAGMGFSEALRSILRQDPDVILVGEIRDSATARIAVQAAQTGHLVLSTLHTNDSIAAVTRLKDLGVEPFLIGNAVLGILAQRLVRKLCPSCYTWESPLPLHQKYLPVIPERIPVAHGCPRCLGTGYSGRIAIFELLPINNEVRECILSNGTEADLRKIPGLFPLWNDGIDKMLQGHTSVDELMRVLPAYSNL